MALLPSLPTILLVISCLCLERRSLLPFALGTSTYGGASQWTATALVAPSLPVGQRMTRPTLAATSFSVPSKEMDADLSSEEKRVVSVVRTCSPSVAFVTSVLETTGSTSQRRKQSAKARPTERDELPQQPRGRSLGSGSGFVVDERGYIVTNYHVIEQTHRFQQAADRMPSWLQQQAVRMPNRKAQIYVRIDGAPFRKCTLVDVEPDRDIAVLKVDKTNETEALRFPPLPWGDSTQLLVGQSLIAIGNPFGLDQTVTTGVVSALGRDVGVTPTNRLRNCIQTDCSINPGNSGGPLLNPQGRVVGVNTAIVSTSGSSAGIGFAIPVSDVELMVRDIITQDAVATGQQPQRPYWGLSLLRGNDDRGVVVATVKPKSPADVAGVRPLTLRNQELVGGDAIVAVAGTPVATYRDFSIQQGKTRANEKLAVTLEDVVSKDRRVVYIPLAEAKAKR